MDQTAITAWALLPSRIVRILGWCLGIVLCVIFSLRTGSWIAGIGNALAILTTFWVIAWVSAITISLFNKLGTGSWFPPKVEPYSFTALSMIAFTAVLAVHVATCILFALSVPIQIQY